MFRTFSFYWITQTHRFLLWGRWIRNTGRKPVSVSFDCLNSSSAVPNSRSWSRWETMWWWMSLWCNCEMFGRKPVTGSIKYKPVKSASNRKFTWEFWIHMRSLTCFAEDSRNFLILDIRYTNRKMFLFSPNCKTKGFPKYTMEIHSEIQSYWNSNGIPQNNPKNKKCGFNNNCLPNKVAFVRI